jgi:hypothetical protein
MNTKALGLTIAIVALFLVITIAAVSAVFLLPVGTGYKVKLTGTASYSSFPSSWSVTYSGSTQEKDKYIFATQPGLWIWDTGGIVIEIVTPQYQAEKSYPSVSSWLGGSLPNGWSVDLRHVEPGQYTGVVNLYEVVGGFFGFGGTKTLKDSENILFSVVET